MHSADHIFGPLGLVQTSFPGAGDAAVPDRHAHGYMFQSNGSATIDDIELTAEQRAAALAGTLPPVDVTHWNPSPAWTAGASICTVEDMAVYTKALVGGRLLDADMQRLRLDSIAPVDPGKPDGTGYGLGLARMGPHLIGHTGIAGYDGVAGYDPTSDLLVVILTNLNDTPAHTDPAVQLLSPVLDLFYAQAESAA